MDGRMTVIVSGFRLIAEKVEPPQRKLIVPVHDTI